VNPPVSASPQVIGVIEQSPAATAELPPERWTRADLARYIIGEIARVNGPQLPVQQTDQIITGFFERYGAMGVRIARLVFGRYQGMWRGAPVTVRRFDAGQDQYFAAPLIREIGA
jgi:hypothetical protein